MPVPGLRIDSRDDLVRSDPPRDTEHPVRAGASRHVRQARAPRGMGGR
jgi:hypothetical protein